MKDVIHRKNTSMGDKLRGFNQQRPHKANRCYLPDRSQLGIKNGNQNAEGNKHGYVQNNIPPFRI